MYKLLLCWRYLRTRYIALASIISVTLGVATMIVVNSVMSGFTTEMQNRIHGILSDVMLESRSINGFPDAEWHMEQVRQVAGQWIDGITPTIAVPAMLNFRYGENWITRQVQLIGIDETTQSRVSDFSRYLQPPANRRQMSFDLREGGYDVFDHQAGPEAIERRQMAAAGWEHRRNMAELQKMRDQLFKEQIAAGPPVPLAAAATSATAPQEPGESQSSGGSPVDPFAAAGRSQTATFDAATQQHTGLVLGIALAGFRTSEGEDRFLALPGDDVKITLPTAGTPPEITSDTFTVVDLYESKMSEYDASFVFVPIRRLQELRGMIDPTTGVGWVNAIQIKLKPGVDGNMVRDKLASRFAPELYLVQTWRDKQGALLAAVQMETAILNILLFLIIAVSGFGILAIFFMIVVEKTRDIGILKSLGASGAGIMGIFLGYGLALGMVGSGVGMVLGLLFVKYINPIADLIGWIRGEKVFDPSIYYFYQIPTIVDSWTVAWIVFGALFIAVLASVLPALRAACLHPVEALRYE